MTELPKIIQVGATADHVRINTGVPYGHGPLDIDTILAELDHVHDKAQTYLARTKFSYDVSMLRAALYALAIDTTMAGAINEIENMSHAEDAGNNMLYGYLASQGWRPYEAVDGMIPQWEEDAGLLSDGGKKRVKLGQQCGGDVIVSLATGTTLVAEAKDAYQFSWTSVPDGLDWRPRDYDRWWFTHNHTQGHGYDPRGEKAREARKALTIPAVPADLDALIARVRTEDS